MKLRDHLRSIAIGGLAFWLPAIVISAILREHVSALELNVSSLLGLSVLGLACWVRGSRAIKWNWVLAGVYILGPIGMLIASAFSGAILPSTTSVGYLLFEVLLCLFPPMTLWLSTLNGMIFSVLIATAALALFGMLRGKST